MAARRPDAAPSGSTFGDQRPGARADRHRLPVQGAGSTSTRTSAQLRRGHARQTAGIRRAGAAALDLCDVACGRFEAFWELTLAPWDMAGGMLIVREAGAVVTTVDGVEARVEHTTICAGSPAMHAWLLATIGAA